MNIPAPSAASADSNVAVEIPARDSRTGEILTYTPGYVPHKIGMILVCLFMITLAATQLVPALRLVTTGVFTHGEALHLVKTRDGAPDEILTKDAQWKATEALPDRATVFWNVYRIHLPDGTTTDLRAPVGSFMKPAQPLLDADGLPNTVPLFYDPAQPTRFVLPAEFSTWFFPGTLTVFGLMGIIAGCMLLYHARTPIALPHIAEAAAVTVDPTKTSISDHPDCPTGQT